MLECRRIGSVARGFDELHRRLVLLSLSLSLCLCPAFRCCTRGPLGRIGRPGWSGSERTSLHYVPSRSAMLAFVWFAPTALRSFGQPHRPHSQCILHRVSAWKGKGEQGQGAKPGKLKFKRENPEPTSHTDGGQQQSAVRAPEPPRPRLDFTLLLVVVGCGWGGFWVVRKEEKEERSRRRRSAGRRH